jgi:ABC-type tungstate transport system substrate-binding protein
MPTNPRGPWPKYASIYTGDVLKIGMVLLSLPIFLLLKLVELLAPKKRAS